MDIYNDWNESRLILSDSSNDYTNYETNHGLDSNTVVSPSETASQMENYTAKNVLQSLFETVSRHAK